MRVETREARKMIGKNKKKPIHN
jgi:hypothetical protein